MTQKVTNVKNFPTIESPTLGEFTVKSAWEKIRVYFNVVGWSKWVWYKLLSPKISVFMWKSIPLALPFYSLGGKAIVVLIPK